MVLNFMSLAFCNNYFSYNLPVHPYFVCNHKFNQYLLLMESVNINILTTVKTK